MIPIYLYIIVFEDMEEYRNHILLSNFIEDTENGNAKRETLTKGKPLCSQNTSDSRCAGLFPHQLTL